jgi:hypothetical protein
VATAGTAAATASTRSSVRRAPRPRAVGPTAIRLPPAFRGARRAAKLRKTLKGRVVNDYLTAIAATEIARNRVDWTHAAPRPARRRRKPSVVAALVRTVAPRRIAVAHPATAA